MWFLIKSSIGLIVLALAAYTVFFVDMAGKPLANHTRDIWVSEVVQEKVDLVRDGVRQQIEDQVVEVAQETARAALYENNQRHKRNEPREFTDEDRQSLDDVIGRD